MEYLPIDQNKIKVICEADDLLSFGLSSDTLEYGEAESQKFFEEILSFARRELGFDTKRRRVLIQLYPSRDGGCEIYISNVGSLDADARSKAPFSPCKEQTFSFDSLSALIFVCKALRAKGFKGNASAFFSDHTDKYYLTLSPPAIRDDLLPLDEYSFILEYGEAENASSSSLFLGEYARCVCRENAISAISRL